MWFFIVIILQSFIHPFSSSSLLINFRFLIFLFFKSFLFFPFFSFSFSSSFFFPFHFLAKLSFFQFFSIVCFGSFLWFVLLFTSPNNIVINLLQIYLHIGAVIFVQDSHKTLITRWILFSLKGLQCSFPSCPW